MNENLTAGATTLVDADRAHVWEALLSPKAIKAYMFGADVESDWKIGSPITWKGEFNGKKFEDKGEVLHVVPEKTLVYSHFNPMAGKPDMPENYHLVTVDLSDEDDQTRVWLSQDNNPDEKARYESEKNWTTMLNGLKQYVENATAQAA